MIGNAFLAVIQWIFDRFESIALTVVGWMPTLVPPDTSAMVAAIAPIWGGLGWVNKYVPLVECAAMLALYTTVRIVMYLVNFGVWLGTKMHLLGGS